MSYFEKLDLFVASLPQTCLYCRYGYPVVFGIDRFLNCFACGAHNVDGLRSKKLTLHLTTRNAVREANKGAVMYAPLLCSDEGCESWKPLKVGGRKFKLLDLYDMFDDCPMCGRDLRSDNND